MSTFKFMSVLVFMFMFVFRFVFVLVLMFISKVRFWFFPASVLWETVLDLRDDQCTLTCACSFWSAASSFSATNPSILAWPKREAMFKTELVRAPRWKSATTVKRSESRSHASSQRQKQEKKGGRTRGVRYRAAHSARFQSLKRAPTRLRSVVDVRGPLRPSF